MMPPFILILRFVNEKGRFVFLFIPLFLLYPLVLVAVILGGLLYPFLMMGGRSTAEARGGLIVLFHIFTLLAACKGLEIDADGGTTGKDRFRILLK